MNKPEFTVIIPTCKRPRFLERAVGSVLSQTFGDFECIVVDDSGDPGTPDIRQTFPDRRLVLIRHESNKGVSGAVNTGIKASRGDLITVLNDDDEYYPAFLEKMDRLFKKAPSRIGFAWTGIRRVKDTPRGETLWYERVWPAEFPPGEAAYIAATTIGMGFGLTMRRECFDAVGVYDESFRVGEDSEYLFRLTRKFDFATIPEILVKIHHHLQGQLTNLKNDELRMHLYERMLTKNADFLARHPKLFFIHYRRLVQLSYSLGMKKKGREILRKIWESRSRRLLLIPEFVCYECVGSKATVWGLEFVKRRSAGVKKAFMLLKTPSGKRGGR